MTSTIESSWNLLQGSVSINLVVLNLNFFFANMYIQNILADITTILCPLINEVHQQLVLH